MQFQESLSKKSQCPVCGKDVVVRDTRSRKAVFCSRVCASTRTFGSRYRGTMSGPADKPNMLKKMVWEG